MSEGVDTHVLQNYDIQKRLGKGAYGIVWKAVDKRTTEVVALKKIFDAFRNQTDAQRTYREIVFLREFGEHSNIIRLQDVLRADNDRDIYLVFEFMEADLHNVIRKGNILKETHKSYIMYQLLKAMKYLHSANVIHRDMKPSNVLINQQCRVKICDFGLARSLTDVEEDTTHPAMTEYVATRWYRAPEILLASSKYTKGVDMWSIGCIFGEMLLGKPLFQGTSTFNQIERILQHIPTPSQADIASIPSQYGPSVLERAGNGPKKSLENLISNVKDDSLDLLRRLLQFNPDKRITADDALEHSYVASFHNPKEEIIKGYDVTPQLSDDIQLTVDEYRRKLYELIRLRRVSAKLPRSTSDVGANRPRNQSNEAPAARQTYENNQRKSSVPTNEYQTQSMKKESTTYQYPHVDQAVDDDNRKQTNAYGPNRIGSAAAIYGGNIGRSNSYNAPSRTTSATKERAVSNGPVASNSKTNNTNGMHEKTVSMTRATRAGSTPRPSSATKQLNPTVRRSVIYGNEDRTNQTEKASGAQAKVNQKFMSSLRPYSATDVRSRSRAQTPNQTVVHDSVGQRRPVYGNYSNMTSATMARDRYGGYAQNVGTISQTGMKNLGGLLHTTTS